MSFGNPNQFPLEKISSNTVPISALLLGFLHFFFLHILPLCLRKFVKFLSRKKSPFMLNNSNPQPCAAEKKEQKKKKKKKKTDDGVLCREEAETVMGKLGIFCHVEGEELQERFGGGDLSELFDGDEKEPTMGEVKEAFDVFDEDRDGFIDAEELQRVLCILGYKDGLELHSCRKMIKAFDKNGDGRIDFSEFVKFMENCSF